MDSTNSTIVKSLWGNPFVDWVVLDAIHIVGGTLSAWDRWVFEKVDCFVGRFLVSVLLKGVVDGFVCGVLLMMVLEMHCGWNLIL